MSDNADEALALIDEVADLIEQIDDRRLKYRVGREVLIEYYRDNPQSVFAISQATKYLFARLDLHPQEQL